MQKLSQTQRSVIQRLQAGWELGQTLTFQSRYWLQRDGLGRGGPTETVRATTVHSLARQGLISIASDHFPLRRFALTEAGKTCLAA